MKALIRSTVNLERTSGPLRKQSAQTDDVTTYGGIPEMMTSLILQSRHRSRFDDGGRCSDIVCGCAA